MSQKIYIVEDDASIRELESYALKSAGFETLGFENSRDFFAQMESHLPDLILLDIMLPGTDGLKVLETIRSTPAYSKLPVILVTAKTGEIDAVKGLDSGADDYITKPFGVMELISRVKALLRRIDRVKKEDLNYGTIRIDVSRHTVQVDGNEVELTYKEYEILKYLMKNLESRKPASLEVAAFLWKDVEDRTSAITPKYVGTHCPDAFVVGYGLDYAERYRNLPHLGILKPEVYS